MPMISPSRALEIANNLTNSREGEDADNFTLPRARDSKQFDEFAGGSVSEFCELSGEGERL